MAVYRIKWVRAYRRPSWLSLIRDIRVVCVSTSYQSKFGCTHQRSGRSWCLFETWWLGSNGGRQFSMFEHRCLHSIGRRWRNLRIFQFSGFMYYPKVQPSEQTLNQNKLRYLGRVLRVPTKRLYLCARFYGECIGFEMLSRRLGKCMKSLSNEMVCIVVFRLLGWDPRDPLKLRLETEWWYVSVPQPVTFMCWKP